MKKHWRRVLRALRPRYYARRNAERVISVLDDINLDTLSDRDKYNLLMDSTKHLKKPDRTMYKKEQILEIIKRYGNENRVLKSANGILGLKPHINDEQFDGLAEELSKLR